MEGSGRPWAALVPSEYTSVLSTAFVQLNSNSSHMCGSCIQPEASIEPSSRLELYYCLICLQMCGLCFCLLDWFVIRVLSKTAN
jgi:hypothetical protein